MAQHIVIDRVSKRFPPAKRGGEEIVAVDDVSLEIERGEIFGIIGYSGAGKSTLVRLINQLEPVSDGAITIGDVPISVINPPSSAPKDIGMSRRDTGSSLRRAS